MKKINLTPDNTLIYLSNLDNYINEEGVHVGEFALITQKYRLHKINQNSFGYLKEVINEGKSRFKELCPELEFPNIKFFDYGESNGAFEHFDEKHIKPNIYLSNDLITKTDKESLLSTLGHELGHYHMFFTKKNISYKVHYNFKSLSFIYFCSFLLLTSFFFLIGAKLYSLFLFNMFFTWSFVTFKKRLKNYIYEFYADDFASIFLKEKYQINTGVFFHFLNSDTHPSCFNRNKRQNKKPIKPIHLFSAKYNTIFINFFEVFFRTM